MIKHYYGFELSRVIDPGNLEGVIDLGFNMFLKARVELFGVRWPWLDSCDLREREAASKAVDGDYVSLVHKWPGVGSALSLD